MSFCTLEAGGEHDLVVKVVAGDLQDMEDAARVIDVPFEMSDGAKLEIVSVAESVSVAFAAGLCQLRFQQSPQTDDRETIIRLALSLCPSPVFAIVRSDLDLNPGAELLLTANPAY